MFLITICCLKTYSKKSGQLNTVNKWWLTTFTAHLFRRVDFISNIQPNSPKNALICCFLQLFRHFAMSNHFILSIGLKIYKKSAKNLFFLTKKLTTSPSNRATLPISIIDRNTALLNSPKTVQLDTTVDFLAKGIADDSGVVPAFRTPTPLTSCTLRKHPLVFKVNGAL